MVFENQSWDPPPSTASSVPVVKVASKARNTIALAISVDAPIRCIGLSEAICAFVCSATSGGSGFSRMPESIGPGLAALTSHGGATHGRGPVPWSELPPRVQRLEGVLGVRLLERTPQGSHLTAAGAAFLPQAQAVLTSTRQAVIAARGAAAPHVITVGYTEDLSRRYRSPPRVLV